MFFRSPLLIDIPRFDGVYSKVDFDGDSSEEMVVQKTPKNKTPQGRNSQSMSAKKASFELSGKRHLGRHHRKIIP
ncbi:hypothetical protein TNIN_462741 [Trichonephila inaurata madagascariensis]|uniref:Uncharacterized protein n=1 Tax=Trichonephila inaurata madagascariensis TaxID=2747483 RepID=A0A8X6X945_9ARAC|nr:hypothetical protein TNIN_462741 [Trichonephila inaurata madagascariensis]